MLEMVVGGFYGDEGKGKITGYLAVKDDADIVVRAGGGPQAGHTIVEGKKVRQVPGGFINPKSRLLIARGTLINPEILLDEIEQYGVKDRIGVDYGCTIIEREHMDQEKADLVKRVGSVGTGTGPARSYRILRTAKIAKEIEPLKPYLTDVSAEINKAIAANKTVVAEGVHGAALSLLDYKFYPYVTSQDTTASQFAADIGIGPKDIDEVIVVYKSYVSRVGEGPLEGEWDEEKRKEMGIEEIGTVSGRRRRLADFNYELAKDAMNKNSGTQSAITCVDRLFKNNESVREYGSLTNDAKAFISNLNTFFKSNSRYFKGISIISTGPNLEDTIDLRERSKVGSKEVTEVRTA